MILNKEKGYLLRDHSPAYELTGHIKEDVVFIIIIFIIKFLKSFKACGNATARVISQATVDTQAHFDTTVETLQTEFHNRSI